jgi:multidrug resistance efflux pump
VSTKARVREGEVIARLESEEDDAQVRRAHAQVQQAEAQIASGRAAIRRAETNAIDAFSNVEFVASPGARTPAIQRRHPASGCN